MFRPLFGNVAIGVSLCSLVTCFGLASLGCGDLIVPNAQDGSTGGNNNDAGTDGGEVDGSTPGDSGADVIVDGSRPVDCTNQDAGGLPTDLACTGLYSDWMTRTVSADAKLFDPGLHLWSDGAEKTRWIYLPPGTQIDTSDQNEWKFPVNTKVWKEFKLLGKRVETRFLWKVSDLYWFRTTYEWSDDESSATLLDRGRTNVRGLGYEIPESEACATCHAGRKDMLLGFEAVSLGSPNASGLNLQALRNANLLTNPPTNTPVIPGDELAQKAIGFLHSNCGTACHNRSPAAFAGVTGLFMRLEVDATGALPGNVADIDTLKTALNVQSIWQPQPLGSQPTFFRIKPKDAAHSAIPFRDGRRDGVVQMPPLASHLVDEADVKNVTDWINAMP